MSKLIKISLTQFKSFLYNEFNFNQRYIGITGRNGIGKTNLLDAIYYMCYTKSYFSSKESQNIYHDSNGFRIESHWEKEQKDTLAVCKYEDQKKYWWINQQQQERNTDYLGHFHAIMIAPDDINMINQGSDLRRRFVDGILAQEDKIYLKNLIAYQRIQAQKNAYLKQQAYPQAQDPMLDVYDEKLGLHAHYITKKRMHFAKEFPMLVKEAYQNITDHAEEIDVIYDACVNQEEEAILFYKNQRALDIQTRRTTKGIHTEDWLFTMNNMPVKQFGSQGQKKSFLFALKIAQWKWLEKNNINALLLLDDFFEKLDHQRLGRLFKIIDELKSPQIFFTHPNQDELEKIFVEQNIEVQIINLDELD